MKLPSDIGGSTTQTVGLFEASTLDSARWLSEQLGARWGEVAPPRWEDADAAFTALAPAPVLSMYALVPLGDRWTAVFNNTPLGTDVGVLPRRAAKQFGVRAIRATYMDEKAAWPARMLEVYSPPGSAGDCLERVLYSMNDGGRWIFVNEGQVFPFENEDDYSQIRKKDRFPVEVLYRYLRELSVPIDAEPEWSGARALRKTA